LAVVLWAATFGWAWAGEGRPQGYHLTPEQTVKAKAFARARNTVYWGGEAVFLLVLVGMVKLRTGARLGQAAEGLTHRRWLQAWIVVPPVLLAVALAEIPFDIYAEMVSREFGQSIETWGEWAGDWAKTEGLFVTIGTLAGWGLYALLRASPKRWWVWAWLIAIPVEVAATVVEPVIIEPMFYDYQPLGAQHPELVGDIERILVRAGIVIPPDRLYEMKASEKTNALNAYVSGFGPSKRVVLYDTIIAKEKGPPLLATVGHELGHYALHHIRNGLLAGFALTLFALWAAAMALRVTAPAVQPGVWDTVPEMLLVLSGILFLLTPAMNAYSRMQEHEADVYSIEVTHGVVPDPGGAAAEAFQIEGESAFADPSPSSFEVFWLYSHPPIADRLRFSLDYNPWRPGSRPRFVAP
jgi:STE24 endopeptidase